ncbi:MAG TPA: DUF3667 domain-containing protein [Gemmatimonadaceae bacterium]|nr:DUF3667 domain-containing protein [Gemmatimonadaceae bacterium]
MRTTSAAESAGPAAGAAAGGAPATIAVRPMGAVCLNCGTPLAGPFCGACGQRHREGRLTLRSVAEALVAQFLTVDRGLWLTIARLTTNPGAVIRDYITGRRRRYVGPVAYVFFGGAIVLLAFRFSERMDTAWIQEQVSQYTAGPDPIFSARQGEAYRRFLLTVRGSQGVTSLLMAVPFALMLRWLFRRSGVNVAEAAVFTLYTLGHVLVLYTVLEPVVALAGDRGLRTTVLLLVGCAISVNAGLTFFGPRVSTAARMLLAYLLSMILVSVSAIFFILAFVR